ncbi:MAG: SPFH domain-containing protein, partial [Bacilli bacterium]
MNEKKAFKLNGYVGSLIVFLIMFAGVALVINAAMNDNPLAIIFPVLLLIVGGVLMTGFTIVQPNSSNVITLFGTYVGVIREQG